VQRWFAAQIDFDPFGFVNTNDFLLAISATADPTGVWELMDIPADREATTCRFSDARVGLTRGYLSANMFDVTGSLAGPTLVSIPKAGC